ncbi:MAG: hypothetical protein EBZ69_03905 [Alphaproteobacteria bacterium]|nr:hypothetical protein [Alphaproteobacteria bacterium]NDC55942.1 hypothetical protein [Alphaproteobacteria bacterium]
MALKPKSSGQGGGPCLRAVCSCAVDTVLWARALGQMCGGTYVGRAFGQQFFAKQQQKNVMRFLNQIIMVVFTASKASLTAQGNRYDGPPRNP